MRPPDAPPPAAAPWMRRVLLLAGAYNLLWGAAVVLLPVGWTIAWTGVEVGAPAIWRCVGMIVGVYGVGYLCAAGDPLRHWPITLVGLLGKTFGPIGFTVGAARGELPWAIGLTIVFNDLIWWPFFAAILYRAADRFAHGEPGGALAWDEALDRAVDGRGRSLRDLSDARPRLLVAVRHVGCTFCRQELAKLSAQRGRIEAAGASPVVVTLSSREDAEALTGRYGLGDVPVICNPGRTLYRALELGRGDARELFDPRVWLRGIPAFARHGVGPMDGDGFQMPGAFVVSKGEVLAAHRHRDAADAPDFAALAASASPAARIPA